MLQGSEERLCPELSQPECDQVDPIQRSVSEIVGQMKKTIGGLQLKRSRIEYL